MNCGECLNDRVQIVKLDDRGVCPKCGTDYSDLLLPAAEPAPKWGVVDLPASSLGRPGRKAGGR